MKNTKECGHIVIPLIVLAIFVACYVTFVVFPDGFGMPMNPDMDHFGIRYAEIYTFQTKKEKEIGEEIVGRTAACMEYTGDEELAEEKDKLSEFYYFPYYERPASVDVSVKPVKCVAHGKKGSVWFRYSLEWRDENGEIIHGACDILTRCAIEKDNSGDWWVTEVSRHP